MHFTGHCRCFHNKILVMQGANYRLKAGGKKLEGEVSLVLGAGNQTPVACMDILHKLFFDDAVVICKMNPVNEYLGKYIRYGSALLPRYQMSLLMMSACRSVLPSVSVRHQFVCSRPRMQASLC